MVWMAEDARFGACETDIHIDGELAEWADALTDKEVHDLGLCGVRALPLKVNACGLVGMCHVSGTCEDVEPYNFNRAFFATSFDFGKITSMEVSLELHTFKRSIEDVVYCVMCLLSVSPNSAHSDTGLPAGQRHPVLSFPFLFCDLSNPLTHWALVNSKKKGHFIIRHNIARNIRHERCNLSANLETSILRPQLEALPKPAAQSAGHVITDRSRALGVSGPSALKEIWAKLPLARRSAVLSFDDLAIFERVLSNMQSLLTEASGGSGTAQSAAEIHRRLEDEKLYLLSSLEFLQGMGGGKVMFVSDAFLRHAETFWAFLERSCPKFFSGRLRRRRRHSEWLDLLEPPARDLQRLQQRVAQLIEQKLWDYTEEVALDVLAQSCELSDAAKAKQATHRRRRRNRKSSENSSETNSNESCMDGTTTIIHDQVLASKCQAHEVIVPSSSLAAARGKTLTPQALQMLARASLANLPSDRNTMSDSDVLQGQVDDIVGPVFGMDAGYTSSDGALELGASLSGTNTEGMPVIREPAAVLRATHSACRAAHDVTQVTCPAAEAPEIADPPRATQTYDTAVERELNEHTEEYSGNCLLDVILDDMEVLDVETAKNSAKSDISEGSTVDSEEAGVDVSEPQTDIDAQGNGSEVVAGMLSDALGTSPIPCSPPPGLDPEACSPKQFEQQTRCEQFRERWQPPMSPCVRAAEHSGTAEPPHPKPEDCGNSLLDTVHDDMEELGIEAAKVDIYEAELCLDLEVSKRKDLKPASEPAQSDGESEMTRIDFTTANVCQSYAKSDISEGTTADSREMTAELSEPQTDTDSPGNDGETGEGMLADAFGTSLRPCSPPLGFDPEVFSPKQVEQQTYSEQVRKHWQPPMSPCFRPPPGLALDQHSVADLMTRVSAVVPCVPVLPSQLPGPDLLSRLTGPELANLSSQSAQLMIARQAAEYAEHALRLECEVLVERLMHRDSL